MMESEYIEAKNAADITDEVGRYWKSAKDKVSIAVKPTSKVAFMHWLFKKYKEDQEEQFGFQSKILFQASDKNGSAHIRLVTEDFSLKTDSSNNFLKRLQQCDRIVFRCDEDENCVIDCEVKNFWETEK